MSPASLARRDLVARGLTLATPRGTVFGPVDLHLPPRTHGAVLGTQGSGRSALLLALTGRLQGVTGELSLGRVDAHRYPHVLRRATAVAHISDHVELEPLLTVAECIDEHSVLEGVSRRVGRERVARLEDLVDFHPDRHAVVGGLPAEDRTVLACLLACVRPAELIVYDDVDSSLTLPQLERVYDVLGVLGSRGHRFVVSALASSPVPHGAVVVELPTPGHAESAPPADAPGSDPAPRSPVSAQED